MIQGDYSHFKDASVGGLIDFNGVSYIVAAIDRGIFFSSFTLMDRLGKDAQYLHLVIGMDGHLLSVENVTPPPPAV